MLRRSVSALRSACQRADVGTMHVIYPQALYLGGNIVVNDMCVVSDLVAAISASDAVNTDVVVVPDSGFNDWGMDLSGVHWGSIERLTGIRTVLLQCVRFPF
jgi:hypothetical protein